MKYASFIIISSNSTMVGENYEELGPQIPRNTMKTHKICKLDRIVASNVIMVGDFVLKF